MLDVSVSYSRFRFLGPEFLTWIWFALETMDQPFSRENKAAFFLELGGRIVLEKRRSNRALETISIQAEDPAMAEGRMALQKGAKVTQIHLVLRQGERRWQFCLKADGFQISGLKTPENPFLENEKDVEAALLERLFQIEAVYEVVDHLYGLFLKQRLCPGWPRAGGGDLGGWIRSKIDF